MPVGRMVVTGSFTTFTPTPGLVDGRSHRCNALSPRVLKLSRFIGARCTWLNSKMNNFFPRNTFSRFIATLHARNELLRNTSFHTFPLIEESFLLKFLTRRSNAELVLPNKLIERLEIRENGGKVRFLLPG